MEDKVLKSLISGILLCGILFQAAFASENKKEKKVNE